MVIDSLLGIPGFSSRELSTFFLIESQTTFRIDNYRASNAAIKFVQAGKL